MLSNLSVLSTQLSRHEVERIAFSAQTDNHIAYQFQYMLQVADEMIKGTSESFPGEAFPEWRVLFVCYPDGLKIWID